MDFALARKNMVESQLMANKVVDEKIIERYLTVSREPFVDNSCRNIAYADTSVRMAEGRKMLKPVVGARLLQALDLQPEDTLLVVASGTGYVSSLAAPLVKKVYEVEANPYLSDIAKRASADLFLTNTEFYVSDPKDGLLKKSPFNKIFIASPMEEVPVRILDQLKKGGKLVCIVKNEHGILEAVSYTKEGDEFLEECLFETFGEVLDFFAKEEEFKL